MSEAELHAQLEALQRRLDEAEQSNRALVRGEIDAAAHDAQAMPLLLHAAQEKLRASEHMLRAVFDGAMDAMLIADGEGRCVDANAAACQLFGLSRPELLGRSAVETLAPGAPAEQTWPELLRTGSAPRAVPFRSANGTRREVEGSVTADVLPGLHLCVLRDVTARNMAERALREAEQRLRTVISNAPIVLFAFDREGRYTLHEGRALAAVGLRAGELLHQSVLERQPQGRPFVERALAGEEVHGEYEAGGQTFDCTLLPVRDEHGTVIGATGVAVDVTTRKRAEDAVRASEARFRAMVEKSHEGVTLLSAEFKVLYISPAVSRLLGYTSEELRESSWSDFLGAQELTELQRAAEQLRAAPSATVTREHALRHKDGGRRIVEVTATNLLDDPDIRAIVVNIRDVTQRRAIERERNEFFHLSLDLLCIAGLDGKFHILNPAWGSTLGWSLEELTTRPWLEFVHPDDRAATENEGAALNDGRITKHFEHRFRCRDGTYRRLQWTAIPAVEDGLIYAVARDVTHERAVAERDRLLFAENPVPMFLTDLGTLRFLDVNEAALEMYGYRREEFLAMKLSDIVIGEEVPDVRRAVDDSRVEPRIRVADRRHRTGRGAVLDIDVTALRLRLGERQAILSVVVDVTERKRMERELRARELQYRRIVNNAAEGIWVYDADGKTLFMNPRMAEMLGWTVEETLGRPIFDFMDEPAAVEARERIQQRIHGARETYDFRLKRRDGTELWVCIHADPLLDEHGTFENALVLATDITGQRRAAAALRQSEEQLRQAQKMEAVGNLAGGIAHDFNNLLSVILSYTDLVRGDLMPSDPLQADLEEIQKAGLRASNLTGQLLAFSRKQMLQPAVLDLKQTLAGVEKMLGRLLGEDIRLTLIAPPHTGKVHADPGQLEQVIMNLAVNARDAMPAGGSLTIEASNVTVGEHDEAVYPGMKPGRYVMLAVTDTGVGMDAATQERIFEPFFTTKGVGKGTGLGLSTVYGIVQQTQGSISVVSEPGKGTTFKVYLPRTDRAADVDLDALQPPNLRSGIETILLVEDEAPVRSVMRTILQKNGYRVLEAENAGEAFLLCEQFAGTIHLLVTDVVMPRMSGRQLAERLAQLRPELRILYISGYTEDTIVRHGVLNAGIEFLPKPITPDALLRKVRKVLDRRAGRTIRPME